MQDWVQRLVLGGSRDLDSILPDQLRTKYRSPPPLQASVSPAAQIQTHPTTWNLEKGRLAWILAEKDDRLGTGSLRSSCRSCLRLSMESESVLFPISAAPALGKWKRYQPPRSHLPQAQVPAEVNCRLFLSPPFPIQQQPPSEGGRELDDR
uniref:heme transporter HRG1 isoform X2 n=1 Tax=Ictidomys tridecemlineatus TaxID=43179 RepID=UPI001A9DFC34|nr:heme transporter HRG1 isoform X2 [Ictidomys tridecemlineatus]